MKTVYIRNSDCDFVFHLFAYFFKEKPSEVRLNPEHIEARWVTIDEAETLPLIPGAMDVTRIALSHFPTKF